MRYALVDRRVTGIIRWLERLRQSYNAGAVESALMDAECARADLENLRRDVWTEVMPEEFKVNKTLSRIINFSKAAFLAVLIVLVAVVPLSKEKTAPALEYDKTSIVLAEPVIIIREYDMNEKITETEIEAPAVISKTKKITKPATLKKTQAVSVHEKSQNQKFEKTERIERIERAEKIEKSVAYDDVFSLMQTGQRALKNNNSVVKIK